MKRATRRNESRERKNRIMRTFKKESTSGTWTCSTTSNRHPDRRAAGSPSGGPSACGGDAGTRVKDAEASGWISDSTVRGSGARQPQLHGRLGASSGQSDRTQAFGIGAEDSTPQTLPVSSRMSNANPNWSTSTCQASPIRADERRRIS
jgi:hypothetical protein